LARIGYGASNYRNQERREIVERILLIKQTTPMAMTPLEGHQLFTAARACAGLSGDVAEVGVFQGATAKLIREALPTKPLHLFDTFGGMPDSQDRLRQGDFCGTLDEVKANLGNDPNVNFYPGYFPKDTRSTGCKS
jgi:O-methyltransferase